MRFRCTACPNNCTPPGKLRGFKLRDHTCPCGGALGRGSNATGAEVPAVPLRPEERGIRDERLGMKRSTSRPRTRGAIRLELMVVLAILAPLGIAGVLVALILWKRSRPFKVGSKVVCRCGVVIEGGTEPATIGKCLACRYRGRNMIR
jgi:hypothetical protein